MQASKGGLKIIRQRRARRGLAIEASEWLEEASKIVNPTWQRGQEYPVSCKKAVWINFLNGNKVKQQSFEIFCQVLRIEDWREVADLEPEEVVLTIGLSSEAAAPIASFLNEVNSIANAFLPKSYPRIRFDVRPLQYQQAKNAFSKSNVYDIIMLDDPWIPSFFENIVHLDEEPLFERILQNAGLCLDDLFTDVFHSSLENVCVYEEHLVGLPVLGNVQMLIHQCSVQERLSPPEDSQLDMDSAFLDLSTLEDFCGATQTRLGIRDDIGSERVAIFWELLRALGHQDKCVGGEITIDLEKAKQARSWLNQFTSRISLRDLRRSLLESHSTMAAAIGWPDWVSSDIANYLSPLSTIRFQQFTEYPTMGSWLLALPREPLNPNFRRYAIEMITALTTNHSIQFFLAKRGNIPVLRTLEHVVELKEIPFWANNYAPIHDALAHALPRPRTPYWIAIEDGLHTMLSNNSRFEDLPGLHFLPSQRSEV